MLDLSFDEKIIIGTQRKRNRVIITTEEEDDKILSSAISFLRRRSYCNLNNNYRRDSVFSELSGCESMDNATTPRYCLELLTRQRSYRNFNNN